MLSGPVFLGAEIRWQHHHGIWSWTKKASSPCLPPLSLCTLFGVGQLMLASTAFLFSKMVNLFFHSLIHPAHHNVLSRMNAVIILRAAGFRLKVELTAKYPTSPTTNPISSQDQIVLSWSTYTNPKIAKKNCEMSVQRKKNIQCVCAGVLYLLPSVLFFKKNSDTACVCWFARSNKITT